jgi:hypothetical protein
MRKTQNYRKQVQLPASIVKKIKIRASQKRVSIMQWLLDAAAAAYLSETGIDLLAEEDEHATNAI